MGGPGGTGPGAVSCVAESTSRCLVTPRWVGQFYGEQAPCPHRVAEATCVDVWSRAHSCPQQAGLWATGGSFSLAFTQGLPS